jgi:hypothetical protein
MRFERAADDPRSELAPTRRWGADFVEAGGGPSAIPSWQVARHALATSSTGTFDQFERPRHSWMTLLCKIGDAEDMPNLAVTIGETLHGSSIVKTPDRRRHCIKLFDIDR